MPARLHRRFFALPLIAACLTACGGGGSGDAHPGAPPAAETPGSTTLDLQAAGSSDRSISLRWQAVAGASGYTLQRRQGSGAYATIATLDAASLQHLDQGLAANTDYQYRLQVATGSRSAQAEQTARTGTDAPLVTAAVAPLGEPRLHTVGAGASRIHWPEAGLQLDLPAGALPEGTALQLQRSSNNAPQGQGEGWLLRIGAARTAQPLRLTLGYDATLAPQADGLGVALQQADGSWLSLPIDAHDKTARTVSVLLPSDVGASPTARALAARPAAAEVALEYKVVRYLHAYLAPKAQTLPVGATQLLVPYTHAVVELGTLCRNPVDSYGPCVPVPIVASRELPILNDKPGYSRRWYVWEQEGGNPVDGTVQPRAGAAGAVYTAPPQVPDPKTVPVALRSVNLATGQSLVLTASMTIVEPVWRGNFNASISAPGGDTGFLIRGEATFRRDPATGRYQQTGLQTVTVQDFGCNGTVAPGSQPLPPGLLEIDMASGRYRLVAGSAWDAVLNASCPGHGSTSIGWRVPGELRTEGTLSGSGRVMHGVQALGGVAWDWSFTLVDE